MIKHHHAAGARRGLFAIAGLALSAAVLTACATNENPNPSVVGAPRADRPIAIIDGQPAQIPDIKMGNPRTINRIIAVGLTDNRVMDHLTELCETFGHRLTGSVSLEDAQRWTVDQFRSWGLTADLEEWGTIPVGFDRGPSIGRIVDRVPVRGEDGRRTDRFDISRELEFTTFSWMAGTEGLQRGRVIKLPADEDQLEAMQGQLAGSWVLVPPPTRQPGRAGIRAQSRLVRLRHEARVDARAAHAENGSVPENLAISEQLMFKDVLGFITTSDDERVWTSSVSGWRELDYDNIIPDTEIIVRRSDYDHMNSRLADGEELWAEFDLPHHFRRGPVPLYNVIAEIPGTTMPEEVVILCAHIDSWNGPGSQGTVDNGVGVAVMMEAARILMAADARPKRTIRIIFWSGEEQGLLGARAYVQMHSDKLHHISAVLNDDGGTNYQGWLEGSPEMVPYLAAATAPVNNLFWSEEDGQYLNIDIRTQERFRPRVSGSDHWAFFQRGVPAFYWGEVGRADYGRGWHTQYDRMDLAIPEYLRQSAVASAITAYNLASAPTLLPWNRVEDDPRLPNDQQQQETEANNVALVETAD